MTALNQLPPELISLIIHHVAATDLATFTLVDKSFYKLSMPLLWHHFDLDSDDALNTLTGLMASSSNAPGQYIRSIRISNCESLTDASFLALIQHMPRLEILAIPQADKLSDASLQHVPRHCPFLTSVDLFCSRIPEDCDQFTHVSIAALGQHCHQLRRLSLYGCAYLDYLLFFSAFQTCPLTHLRLSLPYILEGHDIPGPALVDNAALKLHHHHHQALTSLTFSECDIDMTTFITASNKHHLTWPQLTEFSLWSAPSLTDAMAIAFLQRHPQLQTLSLHHSHLSDDFLAQLPTTVRRLTHLDMDYSYQLTVEGLCRMSKAYAGQLTEGVSCAGCGIYEKNNDFPPALKRMGLYRLNWEDIEDPEVVWILGHAFSK